MIKQTHRNWLEKIIRQEANDWGGKDSNKEDSLEWAIGVLHRAIDTIGDEISYGRGTHRCWFRGR
jgi:hypothetical protein